MADKLSDIELVEELRRFGEEVKQPIDRKKRPILVKKLNHLRARENAPNRQKKASNPRKKQNAEFSSAEDESEIEDVAAPSASNRLLGRRSLRHNTSAYSSITDTMEVSPSTRRTNLKPRRSMTRAKDLPVVNSTQANTPGPSGSHRLYPDLSRFTGTDNTNPKGKAWKYQRNTKTEEDSYDYKGDFSDSDPEESMYEVVNKSMNTTFPIADSSTSRNEDEDDDDGDEDDSILNDNRDYNTRFSNRLRDRHEVSKNNLSKTTTPQTKKSKTSNHVNSFTEEEIRQHGFKTHEDSPKMKPQVASYVSTGILVVMAVFFVSLGMLYIYMRGDLLDGVSSVFTTTDGNDFVHLPICRSNENTNDNCYSDEEADVALGLVTTLESFIKSKTGGDKPPRCTIREARETVENQVKNTKLKEKLFNGTLMLILNNPSWNIRVLTKGNAQATTVADIDHLEADPDLSLVARIYGALYKILLGLVLLLCCFLVMMIGVLVLRHRQRSKEEERKKVFEMVEKIIDMVKENYDMNEPDGRQSSYLAIQHVRDQLLPPSHRRRMVPLWEKAVKFIEANESRIRVETQTIQGEDFMVWRWLPANSSCGKVWQGQAFGENNVSAGNTLQYSPTPCLKIRNMFDADVETADNWDVNVQDALLEKCKGITGILHVHVDRASSQGCVYMKCNSCETAYQVYRSLHGWWFDGRLVTVKYLRLELYHDRFPNSKKNTKPLLPSNNSMASLSHPYHRSLLEMT